MEKFGLIKQPLDEYPNIYQGKEISVFELENKKLSYDENDIIKFFDKNNIKTFILVNPDNLSGNYINKEGILKILKWATENKINVVVDESLSGFADEEDNSLINLDILKNYKNLYVIKSISKAFGVPGLRLGVLASSNTEMIDYIKNDVSIWNVNSFAEFYMQIYEKYKNVYKDSLVKTKEERARLELELSKIKGIKVIHSQANYVLCEITNSITSKELTKKLLIKHQLFIKDLSNELLENNLIRLSVRNMDDNDKLLKALKEEL